MSQHKIPFTTVVTQSQTLSSNSNKITFCIPCDKTKDNYGISNITIEPLNNISSVRLLVNDVLLEKFNLFTYMIDNICKFNVTSNGNFIPFYYICAIDIAFIQEKCNSITLSYDIVEYDNKFNNFFNKEYEIEHFKNI